MELSQEDLAHKAKMHVTYLSRIENGKGNISLEALYKVVNSLGISLKDLLDFY